jgi:hypothetical protein
MPQSFTSRDSTLGSWSTNAPDDFAWDGDEHGFFPVSRLRQQYTDYLAAKVLEYEEQKQSRHYYHGAQWTPEEIETLRRRRQPIITFNRTGRKIDQIVGLVMRLRQDPKAYPTNPKNADGAEIATQCVRTVLEASDWDHDGDRYGFCRNLKGPQDELNQRRSKALFMSNVTRLIAQKGAVDNVETARREYARPDGYVEYNQGFQKPEPDDKTADLSQQLALMQDARSEIDTFANINPAILGQNLGQDAPDEHSGVAINLLQKAGIAELGAFLRNYRDWKKRVYRAVWNVVHRTWAAERWIRITDNDGLARFIQINGMESDAFGEPVIINAIGQLNVEMTLDEGPDEANLMQDAYDVLKQYPPGAIPPQVLLELSPLSSKMKQRVLQLMQQPVDPAAVQAKALALKEKTAEIGEKEARAERHRSQSVSDAARAA